MNKMSDPRLFNYIVVGAGVEGSSTAYQLAKQGHLTLLLEQFPLPHNRGSSHGQSRITRRSYGRDGFYTRMMDTSYTLLQELETETGEELFKQTGTMVISKSGNPYVADTVTCLREHGIPFEQFTSHTIKGKFPMMSFPDDFTFVLEHGGGVLKADKILAAYHRMFRHYGGVLKDGERYISLTHGDHVTVQTNRATYTAKAVVFACGPWSKTLMAQLGINVPLNILRINVCYWKEKDPGSHGISQFPTFLCGTSKEKSFHMYGLPSYEYPGLVKICYHDGPEVDPDRREFADGTRSLQPARDFVRQHFPGLEPEPSIVETCIYSMTPDEHFYLDRHPSHNNVIIAAGFSGHGFKLAPVVGLLLSQLVTGSPLDHSLEPFRLDRFKPTSQKSRL